MSAIPLPERRPRWVRMPGAALLGLVGELGGAARTALALARAMAAGVDGVDFMRALASFGLGTLMVAALTAAFTGGMLVVQSGLYVRELGATELVGWGSGYTMLREVGPVLLALVFAGRVGSRNAAELAAMGVTDQLAALSALGVEPVRAVAAPRALAIIVSLLALIFVADVVALGGGAIAAKLLLDVSPGEFLRSAQAHLSVIDVINGVVKCAAFSVVIAVISTREGLAARGGATEVGRAAARAVARSAITVIVVDLLITASPLP